MDKAQQGYKIRPSGKKSEPAAPPATNSNKNHTRRYVICVYGSLGSAANDNHTYGRGFT